MPRLPTSVLRRARAIDPFLPPLLRPCRDLRTAQNELRWLRQHVATKAKDRSAKEQASLVKRMVKERASGKPLQYVLGTEYFGDLEIRCRPGVLIPRQETAALVTHLSHLLRKARGLPAEVRVLDLCTGTGCIPLLFHHEFSSMRDDVRPRLLGVDISLNALGLANHNLEQVRKDGKQGSDSPINFIQADVLIDPFGNQTLDPPCIKAALNFNRLPVFWDILTSNPPYISPAAYWKTTTRSVRAFEPKTALVPPSVEGASDTEQGDAFYPRLLDIARDVEARVVLLEVADMDQAVRVAQMARKLNIFTGIEIWRDWPDQNYASPDAEGEDQGGFPVIGTGHGRSVLCWRNEAASWLGKRNNIDIVQEAYDSQSLQSFSTSAKLNLREVKLQSSTQRIRRPRW